MLPIAIAVMVDDNPESLKETLSLISKISIFDKVYACSDSAETYLCIQKQGCDVLFTETDKMDRQQITYPIAISVKSLAGSAIINYRPAGDANDAIMEEAIKKLTVTLTEHCWMFVRQT